jgi:hypothetical protein
MLIILYKHFFFVYFISESPYKIHIISSPQSALKKNPKMETNTVTEIYVHISTEMCYRFLQHNHLLIFLISAFEI